MKPLKIKDSVTTILILILTAYTLGMLLAPEAVTTFIGYRFYIVMTDSMNSKMPPGTLLLSRNITPEAVANLQPGTIITFKVDDLGRQEIFTHYYQGSELDAAGERRVYTQGEKTESYDTYTTYAQDVLGTHVFHLPFIGKIILFYKSPFGLINLGLFGIIWAVYTLLWRRFDREEHFSQKNIITDKPLRLNELNLYSYKPKSGLSGELYNPSQTALDTLTLKVSVWTQKEKPPITTCTAISHLPVKGKVAFQLTLSEKVPIVDYKVQVFR